MSTDCKSADLGYSWVCWETFIYKVHLPSWNGKKSPHTLVLMSPSCHSLLARLTSQIRHHRKQGTTGSRVCIKMASALLVCSMQGETESLLPTTACFPISDFWFSHLPLLKTDFWKEPLPSGKVLCLLSQWGRPQENHSIRIQHNNPSVLLWRSFCYISPLWALLFSIHLSMYLLTAIILALPLGFQPQLQEISQRCLSTKTERLTWTVSD